MKLNFKLHFVITLLITIFLCHQSVFAQQNGPSSPEAAGFEPVDASDMVSLTTGDMSYVLPLVSIDGFPINLSYHAGITSNLDASWVGLGWYLNPGAINRALTNTPDDWKGGVGINFTSYSHSETYFGVTADVGFANSAQVGVGVNWGAGKGMTGSVRASLGFKMGEVVDASVGASADTRGNVGVNAGVSVSMGSYKAGASYSYSITGKKGSFGIGISAKNTEGSFVGVGASFSSDGASFGISGGSINSNREGGGASVGMGSASFSAGDMTVDQDSFAIAIPVYFYGISFTLGFSKTKVTYKLRKGYLNNDWGALYASDFTAMTSGNSRAGNIDSFYDYQKRTKSFDMYSTKLPQTEEDFIGDSTNKFENINFDFVAYDKYSVNAQGLSGVLTPSIFQNITIFGKGQRGKNEDDDIHLFWHHGTNSSSNVASRKFGSSNRQLYFNFEGKITSRETVIPSNINTTSNKTSINSYLFGGGYNTNFANSYKRARSSNFVEVFTNAEIQSGLAKQHGLITPTTINDSDRNNVALFDPNGIGAYMITSPDGKTYHFALPVYHFEFVQRDLIDTNESANGAARNVKEKRQYSKYATHWLLTAVTGSDYIDNTQNGIIDKLDETDYGFWVELEYGKWTDGLVWRNPYNSDINNYNTNLQSAIEDDDKGYYQFGRKQLYYLDKVKSRNQTALFIKDIRYDAVGKELNFSLTGGYDWQGKLNTSGGNSDMNETEDIYIKETGVHYKREYNLKLDKIVLLKTEIANQITKNNAGILANNQLVSNFAYIRDDSCSPGWISPDFTHPNVYGSNYSYSLHNESLVLDVNDISQNFIDQHALKVIEFNHDYSLAKNSESSADLPSNLTDLTNDGIDNGTKGKLTLNSITFKGKGGFDYMPAYNFDYYMKDLPNISLNDYMTTSDPTKNQIASYIEAIRDQVDNWGFLKGEHNNENKAKAWSLKEITTPTGAKIEIDYGEDDYWTEAFSRRYWQDFLKFRIREDHDANKFYIDIENETLLNQDVLVEDFRDYFIQGEKTYIKFWLESYHRSNCVSDRHRGKFGVLNQNLLIESVNENGLTLSGSFDQVDIHAHDGGRAYDRWYSFYRGSNINDASRGYYGQSAPGAAPCEFHHHRLYFKFLANKVPEDETGGGLRVKELRTKETDKTYKVTYNYNNPFKNNRSSGITSYAPISGLKFVPYQSELPAPGVMYEYVTMTERTANGDFDVETRYRHHVLKPVPDIFNPNITMNSLDEDDDQTDDIFWASVEDIPNLDGSGSHDSGIKKVEGKKINININTSLVGQIKSIETLNSFGHVLSKVENEFIDGRVLVNDEPNKGFTTESFNTLKSIFQTDEDGGNINHNNTKRLLSISTKTEYNSMLKKTITTGGGHQSWTEYKDIDAYVGSFRTSISQLSDGTHVRSERIPAYEFYDEMGSKVLDPSYKNMLTQEAMSITSIDTQGNGVFNKTLSANISTWNKDWSYRNHYGNETDSSNEIPVWRKHKSFVWKENVNGTTGAYLTPITKNNTLFNWGLGIPTNDKWQKVSEVTRYTHWSSPLEGKDINNNFASSKMADNWTKVITNANARYTEMYYSGAEYVAPGSWNGGSGRALGNVFDGEVYGSRNRTNAVAHTGNYSVKTDYANDTAFGVHVETGNNFQDFSKDFRPGKYKVSFWALVGRGNNNIALMVDGLEIAVNERIQAGKWSQFNYIVDLPPNSNFTVYATDKVNVGTYFDDFRLHPIYASMNSYVYDKDTDELSYILGANNLATYYCYDDAGRLCKTFKEVIDDQNIIGGFKLVSNNTYHYKNSSISSCQCLYENQAAPDDRKTATTMKLIEVEKGTYTRTFEITELDDLDKYTFEWQWLTDVENKIYSDFVLGKTKQAIPFAPQLCEEGRYNKIWDVNLKITNIETNEVSYQNNQVALKDCKFEMSLEKWADIEISTNYKPCSDNSKYTFKLFVIKPEHENYIFEYQSYNPKSDSWSTFTDVTQNKGIFCPNNLVITSLNCKEERMNYYELRYRVTDINTGNMYLSNKYSVYLDCTFNDDDKQIFIESTEENLKYAKEGTVLIKSSDDKMISVYNLFDK